MKNTVVSLVFVFLLFFLTACDRVNDNNIEISKYEAEYKEVINLAKRKIEKLKLYDIYKKSHLAVICTYTVFLSKGYVHDSLGIINFQIILDPVVVLKGKLKNKKVIIHVHSPGMSGFGHQNNYGKRFLVFLGKDEFNDRRYAENYDFLHAVILDKFEVTKNVFDFE